MTFLRSGFEPFCDGVDLGNIESSMGWCLFGGVGLLATGIPLHDLVETMQRGKESIERETDIQTLITYRNRLLEHEWYIFGILICAGYLGNTITTNRRYT